MNNIVKKLLVVAVAICLIAPLNFVLPEKVSAEETFANDLVKELSDLDKQIDAKKKDVAELQKKSEALKKQIEAAQNKALSLENELAILSNKIAKIKLDIEAAQKKIEEIDLEIKNLEIQIAEKETNINKNKERISEFLRLIYRNDQKSYLTILASNKSFSEFFDQAKYIEELQANLQGVLNQVQDLKTEMESKKTDKENKKQEQEKLKNDLTKLQSSLEEQMVAKEVLLDQTFSSERKFQNFLLQSKYEEEQINSEIYSLEKSIRKKLEESDNAFSKGESGSVVLSWPVDPSRGITATFHDPDYPFRYIFEHPAIDIRASQGTPIAAPAPGYVARVKNGGARGYSYVMLIHSNGISTVFGHVSKINVQEDTYVIRGQIIGLSGGMPGTPGAGRLTTGPHLHFETRLDGIPVNPLNYLP
jgi:murein DD-endopeptidase MepM/ murein hydrolase activator NlpD